MKHLLKYLKPYLKESILGPLFKLIEASFELLVPLVVARIMAEGIGNNDYGCVLKYGAVMVGLALIGLCCAVTAQYFAAKAAVGFAATVRKKIFENIEKRSYRKLDEYQPGTLITRITADLNQLQTGVNLVLRLFLRSPFIVFGAVVMAFLVDVKGALVFCVCVPLLFIVVFIILLVNIPLFRKVQKALDGVTVKTRENITGVRVLRAFRCEDKETEIFRDNIDSLKKFQLLAGRVGAFMNPVTYLLVNASTLGILYVCADEVNMGALEQASLIALLNYMSQILVELIKLANLIITVTKSLACADRIADLLKDDTKEKDITQTLDSVESVRFENVSFMYDKAGKESLSDVSFSAKKGETIGIIGGTGSGKSTFAAILAGFYNQSEGKVYINDVDRNELVAKSIGDEDPETVSDSLVKYMRKMVNIVPQTAVLFAGTVADNLRIYDKNSSDEELKEALKRACALDFVEEKEGGLYTEVTEGGKNFSGGQKQRISIARALVGNPGILILDDSTSALDYATEKKVREGLSRISGQTITFIISQRAACIMNADRILVFDEGRLVGNGNHDELLKSNEVYREIYVSQFPEEKGGQNA